MTEGGKSGSQFRESGLCDFEFGGLALEAFEFGLLFGLEFFGFGSVELHGGAELDLQNNDGSTALHSVAFLCHTEVVQFLLEQGADKQIRNNDGANVLDTVEGDFEVVKPIYELVESLLAPLGMELDYEHIQKTRPIIADMLR